MLGDINKDLMPIKYEITLHKPDRTLIAYLEEAYEITYDTSFGGIDELNFKIPYQIFKDHNLVYNVNCSLLLGDYLICLNGEKYFMIIQPESKADEKEFMQVQCFSLEYELSKKIIRSYNDTVKLYDLTNPDNGILNYISTLTSWSIGHIDADLMLKYRTFDISEQTALETINELQEKFNCVATYDTINKKINFNLVQNIGMNKGLVISEDNYIKTIGKKILHDEIVTRLYVYGKDDITIRGCNPTGANYIEDFSYFKDTKYMSQGLINALNAYEVLILNQKTVYENNFALLETKQSELVVLQNELATLKTQLKVIQDTIDVAISTGSDYSASQASKASKQTEISSKETQIAYKQSEINSVISSLAVINNQLDKSKNFTSQQLVELDYFVRERTWQDSYISDEKELYIEAINQLKRINQPPIQFEINVIDFLKIVECQHDWKKLKLGDIINIHYDRFKTDIEVRLIGYTHNEDSNELKLKFSNKNKIDDPYQYLKDIVSMAVSTSTTIDMSKYKWDKSEDNHTQIMQIMNNDLDTAKNRVLAGKDQNIIIDEHGIHLTDKNNDMEQLRMINNVIAFTKNGWQNASLAITPNGIVAEKLFGKIIAGSNLLIQNANNTFTVDGAGVTLSGGAFTITEGTNGIKLDTKNGLTITKSDNKTRVIMNADSGFKIQTGSGDGTYTNDVLYLDTSGNANLKGILDAIDIKIGGQSILDGVKIKGGIIEGKGLVVKNNNNVITLQIDMNGNITLGGDITWNSKPSYTASEVGALPIGWSQDLSNYVVKQWDEVWKALTNNGEVKGLIKGKNPNNPNEDALFINADYISGDIITGKLLKTSNAIKYIFIENQWIDFYTVDEQDSSKSLRKLHIGFSDDNSNTPLIELGAGDGTIGNKFYITKGLHDGEIRFDMSAGGFNAIRFNNSTASTFPSSVVFEGQVVFKGGNNDKATFLGTVDFSNAKEIKGLSASGSAKFA